MRPLIPRPRLRLHHLLLERWEEIEAEQGTVFVSMPSLLDPSLAPEGHHIVHTFTPSSMEAWQGLSPTAYAAKKEADANRLIARLEAILPGLAGAINHREVGSPRSHRRFLGRHQGSYGPVPALQLPGLLPMPFNRTAIGGLYCVGDSCFPGQGPRDLEQAAHRIAGPAGDDGIDRRQHGELLELIDHGHIVHAAHIAAILLAWRRGLLG